MASHFIVRCIDCGHQTPYIASVSACINCGSTWREAIYDYPNISHSLPLLLPGRPFDIWRYRELLPIRSLIPDFSLGEGGTPLIRAVNLGMMLGSTNLLIKDERQGPTASFKDRQAAISIAALKEAGINELVIASTGNVALAFSAFAARAGIRLWAFLTSLVPAAKMREVALYGTQVIKITGTYDQAKELAEAFAKQKGIYYDLGTRSIPAVESIKTIAFEISEQLTALFGPPDKKSEGASTPAWHAPDWYIQAVSGGIGPLGVLKGFSELKQMGFIERIPKIACIQAEGCAPMVQAWVQDHDTAVPIESPRTLIHTLATGNPGRAYTLLRQNMLNASGGTFSSVSDEEAFRSMHFLAKMEGLSVEPAAAVAFAGLIKLIRDGTIRSSETIVINCSGHAMPTDRNILGEGWSEKLSLPTQAMDDSPEDGLLAALSNVSIDKFPKIAIVDDNLDVRRLIRRILMTQGNYTLFEAVNGKDAIEIIKKERPNLIILDLMMPEVDGFSVIDILQQDPSTAEIPIIVLTAKELTIDEKQRLQGHIQSLLQKGDLRSDELLEEVKALLK
jgi:threonine synthase